MAERPAPRDGPFGASLPRERARRPLHGRGRYTDDIVLPRMVHAAFVRSPYAHAKIRDVDSTAAAAAPGVLAVVTGDAMAAECQPWTASHDVYPTLKSAAQYPLARDKAVWQGEPVVAVVAETRAQAEDAAELVEIDWAPLDPVVDPERAAAAADAPIHAELGSNLALETTVVAGEAEARFADADCVVEETFRIGRQTGVPLEPRCIIADFDTSDGTLTVHHSHQTPHNMQDNFSRLLGIPEHKVRVICPDVGGAFGVKQQLYGDEIATCALSRLLRRPVKFTADRLESFLTDIHARDHKVTARMALSREGRIQAMEVDDLFAIGAFSNYPRTSIGEGALVVRMAGAPYRFADYKGRLRLVAQTKNLIGHYRGVGHPIAVAVTEGLLDRAAAALELDPLAIRRLNIIGDDDLPYKSAGGITFDGLSLNRCLDRLESAVDLPSLRAEQRQLRESGVLRGFGVAAFIEVTVPGAEYYGPSGIRITAEDGCVVRLEPSGAIRCTSSVTDQGQGTEDGVRQVIAAAIGVPAEDVAVLSGDSATAPHGGGGWASRGAGIAGEAAWRAGRILRANILTIAAAILQADADALDMAGRDIVDANGGVRLSLAELARIAHFRQDTLPPGLQPQLTVSEAFLPREHSAQFANGLQASYVEVDPETGFVRLLRHVVVHDCGRVINPMLVDEQIRGGVVQGIGSALYEECIYDEAGQLLNGSLADYLVPMAGEMPDIEVHHIAPPVEDGFGVKGVGEAGTSGAPGAVLNAINDALRPLGVWVNRQPATPAAILRAIGRA